MAEEKEKKGLAHHAKKYGKIIGDNKHPILLFVIIALVIGGAIYVYKYISGAAAAAAEQAKINAQQKGTGENPTLSVQQLQTLATEIDSELTEFGPYNSDTLVSYFSQLGNDADFYGLEQQFGTEGFGIVVKTNYTLAQSIGAYCDATTITQINSAMAAKGIKEQF